MNKRSLLYGLLIGSSCFAGINCTKFLNKDVQGVFPADQFYTTSAAAVQAVNEAYVELTFTSATANPLWVFGDVASDDAASGDPAAKAATVSAVKVRFIRMRGFLTVRRDGLSLSSLTS